MEVRDDPARDPQYKEDVIDKLREQKDQVSLLSLFVIERQNANKYLTYMRLPGIGTVHTAEGGASRCGG